MLGSSRPSKWAVARIRNLVFEFASSRSSSCTLIVPSWNLGMVAPSRVAVSGASDRLCIAVIVPFLRIQSVAISGSRTMAASSRPTAKPDGPFAYTNISDAIRQPTKACSAMGRLSRSRAIAFPVSGPILLAHDPNRSRDQGDSCSL